MNLKFSSIEDNTPEFGGTGKHANKKRTGEPGIKVPTALYQFIAQHCDNCKEVQPHFRKPCGLIICDYCGQITYKKDKKTTEELITFSPRDEIKIHIERLVFGI